MGSFFRLAGRERNPKELPPEDLGAVEQGCERPFRALQVAEDAMTGSVS